MHRIRFALTLALVIGVVGFALGVGSRTAETDMWPDIVDLEEAEALKRQAAEWYAEEKAVSVEEALRRMDLQSAYRPFTAALEEVAPARLAGSWLEDEGEFRLVAWYTGDEEGLEEAFAIADETDLAVEIRTGALHTSRELEQAMIEARSELSPDARVDGSWVDVRGGAVRLMLRPDSPFRETPSALGADLQQDYGVPFDVEVVEIPSSDDNAYGGGKVDFSIGGPCTSGFSVRNWQWATGVTSAEHCTGAPVTFWDGASPYSMTFVAGMLDPWRDVNWGTVNATAIPWINPGAWVTGRLIRSQQQINDYYCKYGITTGYSCGWLVSKTYQPSNCGSQSCASTWMLVEGANRAGGDSGGPWFEWGPEIGQVLALGVHKGGFGSFYAFYMASNYWDAMGVILLTY
jgi:hypothetical protein